MKKQKRITEAFSISFLDVITCGFGAIILLLMVSRTGDTPILETSEESLQGIMRDLQVQLFEIRGETEILNRELTDKREQLSEWDERVAKLQADLELIQKRYNKLRDDSSFSTILKKEYQAALQKLTAEMKRLLAQRNVAQTDMVAGISADAEYLIFIIDTSGSMFNNHWDRVIKEMSNTLESYPQLKGVQIMSDMGEYMFSQFRGRWIPDTPGRRRAMLNALRSWRTFSNSNPMEGIITAIRAFYDKSKKISIYVYGDEFPGGSMEDVLDAVDRINPRDSKGRPRVEINAVGFPVGDTGHPEYKKTNKKFASLMRELTYRNGGTFVGLN
ncbi:MAG: VWA domain-containing protein [Gammaproteobacteria bacterium]